MFAVLKTRSSLLRAPLIASLCLLGSACQTSALQYLAQHQPDAALWQSDDELDQLLTPHRSGTPLTRHKIHIGHTRKMLIGATRPQQPVVSNSEPEATVSMNRDNWCNATNLNLDFKSDREYRQAILKQISSKWVKPRRRFGFYSCDVLVKTNIYGCVTDVNVGMCEQNRVLKRSISSAVFRASPLPIRSEKDTLLEIKFKVAGTRYAGN